MTSWRLKRETVSNHPFILHPSTYPTSIHLSYIHPLILHPSTHPTSIHSSTDRKYAHPSILYKRIIKLFWNDLYSLSSQITHIYKLANLTVHHHTLSSSTSACVREPCCNFSNIAVTRNSASISVSPNASASSIACSQCCSHDPVRATTLRLNPAILPRLFSSHDKQWTIFKRHASHRWGSSSVFTGFTSSWISSGVLVMSEERENTVHAELNLHRRTNFFEVCWITVNGRAW